MGVSFGFDCEAIASERREAKKPTKTILSQQEQYDAQGAAISVSQSWLLYKTNSSEAQR